MAKYNNDFVVPSSWAPISATSLMFIGTLTAKASNTDVIQIRGSSFTGTSGTIDGTKSEYEPLYNRTDLTDIQVQCPGTANQILKVYGDVDLPASPLSNVK